MTYKQDSAFTEKDMAVAKKCMIEGWSQKSRKYRRLGRVPGGVKAATYLRDNHPDLYAKMKAEAEARFESDCRLQVFHFHEEHKELTEGEFEAWLQLRRESGDLRPW